MIKFISSFFARYYNIMGYLDVLRLRIISRGGVMSNYVNGEMRQLKGKMFVSIPYLCMLHARSSNHSG